LAQRHARVILACRNRTKGQAAAKQIRDVTGNAEVVFEELDLASFRSIINFAKRINENEKQVNILINNAGESASSLLKAIK
jgi:retinol dehydrogenase-12